MYTIPTKKMLILNILEILRNYTDEEHRLSQKEIADLLEKDFSMKVDRKAIKRNLMNLLDFGYNLGYTEITREGKSGEETIYTDWYLERDFSDAELRLLIDNLLFAKNIPYRQCKDLIGKIEGLSNKYFSANAKHIRNLPENSPANPQLFYTIEILDNAIDRNRQVEFSLNEMNYNKERVLRKTAEGEIQRFTFNPYQMVATNGRYYLIGNFDYYDNIAYVRLDHISDIKMLEKKSKSKKNVKGLENGLNLPQHMAEHVYMVYGDTVKVKFKAPKALSDQIVDWFGVDFKVVAEDEDTVTVEVLVCDRSMRFWALQYGMFVEVLEPKSLRNDIIKSIKMMNENYDLLNENSREKV